MKRPAILFAFLTLILPLALAGCIENAPLPTATPSPPPVLDTPTATIVWFPPTATPSLQPIRTQEPTPVTSLELGEVLLTEDFVDKKGWQTLKNEIGSVAYGREEITIALQKKGLLSSLRSGAEYGDFYMEVTTEASLCRINDAYGLLFRAADNGTAYRFLVNCAGLLRLERLSRGEINLIHEWTASGQVRPGSPVILRLGVWASAAELRFYVNDIYQFTVTDKILAQGMVGVFARSAGDSPVTVSFSDLIVSAIDQGIAAPLDPVATSTLTPTSPAP